MTKLSKSIISVSVVAIIVLSTLGVSYSYFTANLSGGESASTIRTINGKMDVAFSGSNSIEFDDSVSEFVKEFTITGTNDNTDMGYKISLVINNNSFNEDDLSYSLVSHNPSNNGKAVTNIANKKIKNASKEIYLGEGYFNGANGIIHKYEFTIYLLDFNKENNKTFNGYLLIEENER